VSKIIVGVDGTERSADALAFASRLARRARADLLLACAYPYDDAAAHVDTQRRHLLREEAQETLDRLIPQVDHAVPVATRTIADRSSARALHLLAVHERASLVVIGSSHRGAVGRVFAGTTAERLLHGLPCPVAVVPHGAPVRSLRTVAVGWDASPESTAAVTAAAAVARPGGSHLRIVRAIDDDDPGDGGLTELLRSLPAGVRAEPALCHGDPVVALAAESERADLLVLGSRGYGPHRAVLLGSVSGRVMRTAACPVIVVPRGVAAPLEDLFRPVRLVRRPAPVPIGEERP
jgi:nucleotide-binding universal stress UspA family protein